MSPLNPHTQLTTPGMLCKCVLMAIAAAAIATGAACAQEKPAADEVSIAGHVFDRQGRPVPNALVFVAQHGTGLPIDRETGAPYRVEDMHSDHATVWDATDDAGAFEIRGLPAGTYRLFAQAWEDRKPIVNASDVNGAYVDLLGSEDAVAVPSDAARALTLKPAGTGIVTFTCDDIGNNETFVFLSRALPQDPVLGPVGWVGPFLGNQIGFNRMPRGQTVFRGLPDGEFGVALFAADNSPGVGAARGTIQAQTRPVAVIRVSETDMIAGWSNARKTPYPDLQPLVDHVRTLLDQGQGDAVWQALVAGTALANDVALSLKVLDDGKEAWSTALRLGPWDRKVALPGGLESTVGKALAAVAWVRLDQRLKQR